jgi:hypothetical protein
MSRVGSGSIRVQRKCPGCHGYFMTAVRGKGTRCRCGKTVYVPKYPDWQGPAPDGIPDAVYRAVLTVQCNQCGHSRESQAKPGTTWRCNNCGHSNRVRKTKQITASNTNAPMVDWLSTDVGTRTKEYREAELKARNRKPDPETVQWLAEVIRDAFDYEETQVYTIDWRDQFPYYRALAKAQRVAKHRVKIRFDMNDRDGSVDMSIWYEPAKRKQRQIIPKYDRKQARIETQETQEAIRVNAEQRARTHSESVSSITGSISTVMQIMGYAPETIIRTRQPTQQTTPIQQTQQTQQTTAGYAARLRPNVAWQKEGCMYRRCTSGSAVNLTLDGRDVRLCWKHYDHVNGVKK